jgi:hypothetical protein
MSVQDDQLAIIAGLLRQRNDIDARIAAIIDRPVTAGHLGEWVAARIFDITLQRSATATALDGHFARGTLTGRSVNVKWYLKREGLLDVTRSGPLDYYLVLAGPAAAAAHSRGTTRPWVIESVHLFDARQLLSDVQARGVKIGTATSILAAQWTEAEIYPRQHNPTLVVSPRQADLLRLLAAPRTH